MQLSANFLIDCNSFFKEQFLLSKNLYNQGRYLINEQYNENKTLINETTLNRKLRSESNPEYNNYKNSVKLKLLKIHLELYVNVINHILEQLKILK